MSVYGVDGPVGRADPRRHEEPLLLPLAVRYRQRHRPPASRTTPTRATPPAWPSRSVRIWSSSSAGATANPTAFTPTIRLIDDDSISLMDYAFATNGDSIEAMIPSGRPWPDAWPIGWLLGISGRGQRRVGRRFCRVHCGYPESGHESGHDAGNLVCRQRVRLRNPGHGRWRHQGRCRKRRRVRQRCTSVEATVAQADGVTVITGQNPSLVPEGAALTVSLTLDAGGATQSKDFVFIVGRRLHGSSGSTQPGFGQEEERIPGGCHPDQFRHHFAPQPA